MSGFKRFLAAGVLVTACSESQQREYVDYSRDPRQPPLGIKGKSLGSESGGRGGGDTQSKAFGDREQLLSSRSQVVTKGSMALLPSMGTKSSDSATSALAPGTIVVDGQTKTVAGPASTVGKEDKPSDLRIVQDPVADASSSDSESSQPVSPLGSDSEPSQPVSPLGSDSEPSQPVSPLGSDSEPKLGSSGSDIAGGGAGKAGGDDSSDSSSTAGNLASSSADTKVTSDLGKWFGFDDNNLPIIPLRFYDLRHCLAPATANADDLANGTRLVVLPCNLDLKRYYFKASLDDDSNVTLMSFQDSSYCLESVLNKNSDGGYLQLYKCDPKRQQQYGTKVNAQNYMDILAVLDFFDESGNKTDACLTWGSQDAVTLSGCTLPNSQSFVRMN